MMKNFCGILCILIALTACSKEKKSSGDTLSGRISISGAWALYPMVLKWAEAYQQKYPGILIDVSAGGAGKGMADALNHAVDLGMISRDVNKAEIEKGAWWVSVVKDAVVPTINEKNPFKDELMSRGLSREEFKKIWIGGMIASWNILVSKKTRGSINVYTRCDACGAAETWAKFVGGSQEDLQGIGVFGDPGLADAIRNDTLGIGYNNINYIYDAKTKKPIKGIMPLPIDVNGNGKIDRTENFYSDRDTLVKAIVENRYPSPPARNLHLVSMGIPENKPVLQFLLWVLSEGQQFVPEAGYIALPKEQLKNRMHELQKKLNDMK
jgi:phosphate transport system substrate-binding protein